MSLPSFDNFSVASSSSSSSFSKVAFLFQSTYHDLQVRSEVHDVLQGMLWDIELTAHLQEQLEQEDQQAQWLDMLQHQRQELEQTKFQSARSKQSYQQWADQLVKELWLFSQDYGHLLEKQQTTTFNLQRELEQTKEQLAAALAARNGTSHNGDQPQLQPPQQEQLQKPNQQLPSSSATTTVTAPAASTATVVSIPPVTPVPSQDDGASKDVTAASTTTVVLETAATTTTTTAATAPAPAVVSLMTASEEEEQHVDGIATSKAAATTTMATPTLVNLDIELLMHIFGFLDALDILNTAQLNIAMYSRVDSLFGLGANSSGRGEAAAGGGADSTVEAAIATATTVPTTTPAPAVAAAAALPTVAAPLPPAAAGTTTTGKPSTGPVETTSAKLPATVDPSATTATVATTPIKPSFMLGSSEASSSLSSSSSLLLGGGKGLFSLLSSSASSSAAAAASKSHKSTGSASSFPLGILSSSSSSASNPLQPSPQQQTQTQQLQQQDKHHQPWTRGMADSLSKKLTDAEMSAIISMTVKLRQRNQDVEQLKLEREELLGKIQGMEAIRQYLLDKIRQVELTLTKTRDDTIRVTQQSASDQEVIAFLDLRVQELEREVQNLTKSKQQLQEESNQAQTLLSQKVSVLSDLLQFERERYRDHDREAKATKKVLVKEVKQCRAQIVALQAQRDGCMEENEKLRMAVLNNTNAPTSHNTPT